MKDPKVSPNSRRDRLRRKCLAGPRVGFSEHNDAIWATCEGRKFQADKIIEYVLDGTLTNFKFKKSLLGVCLKSDFKKWL